VSNTETRGNKVGECDSLCETQAKDLDMESQHYSFKLGSFFGSGRKDPGAKETEDTGIVEFRWRGQ
jgi:hypothetical protein